MQCLSCATELLHAANFCPVCGARLAAPVSDGIAATPPGDAQPPVVHVDASHGTDENVVYLPGAEDGRTVAPNPHAGAYAAHAPVVGTPGQPVSVPTPVTTITPAATAATDAGSRGPGPPPGLHEAPGAVQPPEPAPVPRMDPDNPFGNFFDDGPSAWLADDDDDDPHDGQPRVVGTMLAAAAICMLLVAWVVWARAMYLGAGGAEAGGFVLLSMLMWIWYLSLPREQQHRSLLRRHEAIAAVVDRRAAPLRTRTEGQFAMRRERDRYRAMRDERTRRVTALGEASYRSFRRGGELPPELHPGAQRVLAMEQQMLLQDHRIEQLARPPRPADGPGADTAPKPPRDGQSTAS